MAAVSGNGLDGASSQAEASPAEAATEDTSGASVERALAVVHAAAKLKIARGRQIAILRQQQSGEKTTVPKGIHLEDVNFSLGPLQEVWDGILVQQARVRTRAQSMTRRLAFKRDEAADEKKVNLTLRMMLGVRTAVGCTPDAKDELHDDDFSQKDEYMFPAAGESGRMATLSRELNEAFKFRDYAPKVFKELRSLYGIEESSYIRSVAGKYEYLELITNSKSGSFFFFSHDQKYIIKNMKRSEEKFFLKILPKYYEHHRKNRDSMLVRFCGMYLVRNGRRKIPFIVMTCIDGQASRRIHAKYDLKGSSWHRTAKEGEKVLKDNNLRDANGMFHFGSQRDAVLKVLRADAEFLRDVNVMDYSVFLSVHDGTRSPEPFDRRKLLRRSPTTFFVFVDDNPRFKRIPSSQPSDNTLGSVGEAKDANELADFAASESTAPSTSTPAHLIRRRPDGGIQAEGDASDEVYWMGIIDVLTEFTPLRYLEACYKRLPRDRNTVSCVEPGLYCERFVNFMADHID